jgi:predicted DNA-binding antitoxin AbrB/MazE fold protein
MTIIATYKDGAFVPESPVSLPEGAQVQVIMPGEEVLAGARDRFRSVIGAIPRDELDKMEADIEEAFEKCDPDEWN